MTTTPYSTLSLLNSVYRTQAEESSMSLTIAINRLREHYGRPKSSTSRGLIEGTKTLLEGVLSETPPVGVVRVGLREKEGIYLLRESPDTARPAYVIKRFETYKQARHVHNLTRQLKSLGVQSEETGLPTYMQVPGSYWPLELSKFSVLFLDELPGMDMLDFAPRLNHTIENSPDVSRQSDLRRFRSNLVFACLTDAAYWNNVAPQLAGEKEYGTLQQGGEAVVRAFHKKALTESGKTLEQVTDKALSQQQWARLEAAADNLANLLVIPPDKLAFARDLGIKNIRIRMNPEAPIDEVVYDARGVVPHQSSIAKNIVSHLDLPYDWRASLDLRDPVRLLWAPGLGLDFPEIAHFAQYFLLQVEAFKYQGDHERLPFIQEKISSMVRMNYSERVPELSDADLVNLLIAAIAEAARMNTVIPNVFLSRVNDQLNDRATSAGKREVLIGKFAEIEQENKDWVRRGVVAVNELAKIHGSEALIGDAAELFKVWENATVDRRRLKAI